MDTFGNIVNNGGCTEKYSIIIGTNFYATELPTEKELLKMQELLAKKQMNQLKRLLENSVKKYHIGKQSGGWQFLFAPHIKTREGFSNTGKIVSPWKDTLDSIRSYLNRENVIIEDEYGKIYNSKRFWKEIKDCLFHDEQNAINGTDYDKKNPSNYYKCEDTEYITKEGLKFSTDEDFS